MIRLAVSGATAEVSPEAGGALASLALDGADALRRSTPADVTANILNAACYPCVPYFGRLASEITIDGNARALTPTHPQIGVIHGEGWRSAWRVIDAAVDRVELALDYAPTRVGGWPFAFRARQVFELSSSELRVELSVENDAGCNAPAGLALHPFFPDARSATVSFSAGDYWSPPMCAPYAGGETSTRPDAMGGGAPAPTPPGGRDNTYANLSGDILIKRPTGRLKLSTDAPHLHVYAPAHGEFFCLEPTTHLPGTLLTDPACQLAPGATRSVRLAIRAAN
ncbi:MAG: hypothetical protein GC152_00480 [Alphaproteobacteria bacterium]|nr:hypothetical protein [Alphaproteobacteria bacterium]